MTRAVSLVTLLAMMSGIQPAFAQGLSSQTEATPSIVTDAPPRWVRGTEIELMVVREVNSRTAKVGDRFRLRVNAPVTVDGVATISVGAVAWGEIISVGGTGSAGGRGRLGARLLNVETRWGPLALSGASGTEGPSNTAGVVLGVLGFGLLGLLNKGGNATLKAGDILKGYIAGGKTPVTVPLTIQS
jgi:hypothetical protein